MKSVEELIEDVNADSKKKSCFAAAELSNIGRMHIDKIEEIKYKYKLNDHNYSDYRSESGIFSFDDIDSKCIYFRYTDHWQYGGSCDETITIKIDDLISFDYNKFEEDIKSKKIKELRDNVFSLELQLEKNKKELNDLL